MNYRQEYIEAVCDAWGRICQDKKRIVDALGTASPKQGVTPKGLSAPLRKAYEASMAERGMQQEDPVRQKLIDLFDALDRMCDDLPAPEKSFDPPWSEKD